MKRPPDDEVKPGFTRITYRFIARCRTADDAMPIIGLELRKSHSWMENEMHQTKLGWEITLGKWVKG